MSDVAQAAGVSLVTVSRAINTPEKVSQKTLAQVQQAVEQLGYVPNLMAGSLASNRSKIVAAVVPTISNLVFSEMIAALSATLAVRGYQLLIGQSAYSAEAESALVDAFLGRRVDGLVLTGISQPAALRQKLKGAGIPVVQTWDIPSTGRPKPIDMLVGFSNIEAGRVAARHLVGLGHKNLAFIGADEERCRLRLAGFATQARELGIPSVESELIAPPAEIQDAGKRLERIRKRAPNTSAVFCNNDLLAAGLLFTCQQHRWKVPQQIAVMGLGDLPIARAAHPGLSTIRVPRKEMGQMAGQMLLARLTRAESAEKRHDINFEVVQRCST